MNRVEAREAINQRWNLLWAARTPFQFDNEQFTPPDTGRWARVSLRHTTSRQATLGPPGNRKFDRAVLVIVGLFDDVDEGMRNLDEDAQIAQGIFEGVSFDDLAFVGITPVREIGPDGAGKYQVNVEAQGFYQEVK